MHDIEYPPPSSDWEIGTAVAPTWYSTVNIDATEGTTTGDHS